MLTKSWSWLGLGLTLAACGDILGISNVPRPPVCGGVKCAQGELCANGECYSQSCDGVTCADGAVCKDGGCIHALCVGTSCSGDSVCAGGVCLPTSCSGTPCPAGDPRSDAGVNDPMRSVCVNGACVDAQCVGVTCQAGLVCTGGVCAPCSANECGTRAECLGKVCDDGDACTKDDVCKAAGTCEGTPVVCAAPPDAQCSETGFCDPESGSCVYLALAAGSPCSAGSLCTDGDACDGAGTCVAGQSKDCSAPPDAQCATAAGACDPSSGECLFTMKPKGTACSDGNSCTNPDKCDGAGQCVSGAGQVCSSPPNQCYNPQGACNGNGGCTYTKKSASASCDDGNACTVGDHCDGNGTCVAGTQMVCKSPPACHTSGSCSGGKCVYGLSANNSACPDDGNPCTTDLCSAGVCKHAARANGTACTGGRCCGGRCSNLHETANCGACGAACINGSTCGSSGTGGYACTCTGANYSNSFCNKIYGGSATCYPPGSGAKCNCQNSCPNGATCAKPSGVNYCHY